MQIYTVGYIIQNVHTVQNIHNTAFLHIYINIIQPIHNTELHLQISLTVGYTTYVFFKQAMSIIVFFYSVLVLVNLVGLGYILNK